MMTRILPEFVQNQRQADDRPTASMEEELLYHAQRLTMWRRWPHPSLLRRAGVAFTALMLSLFLFPPCSIAQMEQGTITGSVVDITGAGIAGAEITATNEATQTASKTVSNGKSFFTLPYLTPGFYDVTATAKGFQKTTVTGIHLTVNLSTFVKLTMKVGLVTQKVTVQASPIELDTVNSELGGTIYSEQIQDLPQLGRNPYNLLLLEPGVIQENKGYHGINNSINGGMANSSNILLDGSTQVNTSTGDPGFTPPLDSIGGAKLITNNFSAMYGMSGGGILTLSTKYGTNQFHGDAYDYIRNTAFNANGWYPNHVNQARSPYHENDFGFSLGGPVWIPKIYNGHNKTFFFVSLEWNPSSVPDLLTETVPTQAMRTGDFSGLVDGSGHPITIYDPDTTEPVPGKPGTYTRSPFPNNTIPTGRLSQVGLSLLQYYPLPNAPGTEGIYHNYQDNTTRTTGQDTLLVRMDHNFGQRNKAFFMVGRHVATASNPLINIAFPESGTNGTPGTHLNLQWTGVLSDTWTIRPNLLAEFRANFIHGYAWNTLASYGFNSSTLGLPASFASQVEYPVFPQFKTSDVSPLGTANSAVDNNTEGSYQGKLTSPGLPEDIRSRRVLTIGLRSLTTLSLLILRGCLPSAGHLHRARILQRPARMLDGISRASYWAFRAPGISRVIRQLRSRRRTSTPTLTMTTS